MKCKIVAMILVSFLISWTAASVEAYYVGTGVGSQIINLDAGAKQLHTNYSFGRSGFVPPTMPQSMVLSSNILISQAESLVKEARTARDEAMSVRDEARAKYNESLDLMSKIEDRERNIQNLFNNVNASVDVSTSNAAQAAEFLNKTKEFYVRTLSLSMASESNLSLMKSLLEEAKSYTDALALNATQAGNYLNQTR